MAGEQGLVLQRDPIFAAEMANLEEILDSAPGAVRPAAYFKTLIGRGRFDETMGLLHEPGLPPDESVRIHDGLKTYDIGRSRQPQAARFLALSARAALKAALSRPVGYADSLWGEQLPSAEGELEVARGILEPFLGGRPGYVLGGAKRKDTGDSSGNRVQQNMTSGRRQRHEIESTAGLVFSMLGRAAMVTGNEANMGHLGAAHDRYLNSPDKVGEVRNALFMLLAERSRDNRLGQIGWNAARVFKGLGKATLRGQFRAWTIAANFAPHLLTKRAAEDGVRNWRAA